MKNLLKEAEAVSSLCPQAKWTQRHDGSFDWSSDDITQPTQSEIDAEIIRLQAEYDTQEYARKRSVAYPSVGDQLDMIYKDMKNSTTTHAEAVEAIKTKFPKE